MTDHDISEVRNTSSRSMAPEHPDEYDQLDPLNHQGFKLLPVFSGEMFRRTVQYPIIVEGWEKKNYGRHKRRWLATFTQAERNKISQYHGRFYKWHLVSGSPLHVSLRPSTLRLLLRAVQFFAECT